MANDDGATKFFDALNENYDALIDAIRTANDRGHRISASMIEGAQQSQRDAVELGKQWADAPLDMVNLSSSLLEATTKAQKRALEVTGQWFDELTEAQKEAQDVLQRMVAANRSAGEAVVDLSRGIFSRTSEAIRATGQSVAAAVTGSDGRTASREPAMASKTQAQAQAQDEEASS